MVVRPNESMSVAYSPIFNDGGIIGAVDAMATSFYL